MHPRIAAVLGAHTELGKLVTRELLRSPLIEKVHALAAVDPRDDISASQRDYLKLVLHLDSLDYVENTVARYIHECDLVFCVSGGSKRDIATMGAFKFHKINLDIPRRFIEEMISVGIERIALLSDPAASSGARGSEFSRVKRELETVARHAQREAGPHPPGITVFRVPLLLTDLKDATGVHGSSITKRNKFSQKAALKLEAGPSRAVHVRDVAKAMVADAFHKIQMAEASSEIDPAFRRRDIQYAVLEGETIVDIANERRKIQREYYSERRTNMRHGPRFSEYARQHMNRDDFTNNSARYRSVSSRSYPPRSRASSERQEAQGNDSNESYMSGSPDEEMEGGTDMNIGAENMAYQQVSTSMSLEEGQGPYYGPPSPSPSSEPRRFSEDEEIKHAGTGRYEDSEARGRPGAPVTSVEALGHQLGHRLTVIRNNEYLPDVDDQSIVPSENNDRFYQSRTQPSQNVMKSPYQGPDQQIHEEAERAAYLRDEDNLGRNQRFDSRTGSLQSPPSRSLSFEFRNDLPGRPPDDNDYRLDSPFQRNSMPSFRRSRSYQSHHTGSNAERYPGLITGRHHDRGESNSHLEHRFDREDSRPSSLMTRVTALAERVLAATDRPSTKRHDRLSTRRSSLKRDERNIRDEEYLERQERGDRRAVWETTI